MTRCTWCRRTFTENEWVGHLTVRCWEHQKQPQWTTSPPTEPGWYWARGKGVLEVVQVSRYLEHKQIGLPPKPVIVAWVFGDESERELHEWSHWLRIEAPEVPT